MDPLERTRIDIESSNRNSDFSITCSPFSTLSIPIIPSSESSSAGWSRSSSPPGRGANYGLIASLFVEEGPIYSISTAGDFLFTGSESKNVRVRKKLRDFSGFKSTSGIVKAIVVFKEKIFTGHQDGKIRVWTYDQSRKYKCIRKLPRRQDLLVKAMDPRNYVKMTSKGWPKHYNTVSCLSVAADQGLLYSGSRDNTVKVWRISDSKFLESIQAHDDAVKSVVTAPEGLVFTGSADGTMKAWRRNLVGKRTKHVLEQTVLKGDHAVTAVVVSPTAPIVYAGSSDGLIRFREFDKRQMQCGGFLRGHQRAVLCLAAAGNMVISGSADNSVRVWGREESGRHICAANMLGHSGPVMCLAVEYGTSAVEEEPEQEDGCPRLIVYSGSSDKSVKIWRVYDCIVCNVPIIRCRRINT